MGKPEALKQTNGQLKKYKVNIAAMKETKWTGNGTMKSDEHVVFYSGGQERRNGTGFIIHRSLKPAVLKFKAINDRMCSLQIKAKFFNVTLFSVYASMEDADNAEKDELYTKLDDKYQEVSKT